VARMAGSTVTDEETPGPGTGGPRSAGTRQAILDAARSAFAARGYEQTTIRAVAAEAGIDASMVMRYYGSKAGLFAAAATADLQVPDLRAVPAEHWGEVLVRYLVERWEDTSRDDELIPCCGPRSPARRSQPSCRPCSPGCSPTRSPRCTARRAT
jgi:AcrR family transcriptional regulator